jgi:hypothetical protein
MTTRTVSVLVALAVFRAIGVNAQAPPPKNSLLRLAQPWPDAVEMRQRKDAAEALKLFAAEDPITFTLAADFRAVNRDRDPNSKKQYPAELRFAGEGGASNAIAVTLSARGHSRRNPRVCDYVPLRLQFPDDPFTNTAFEGQDALKLVVQCRNGGSYQQFLLKEYLAYRILNTLTPRSLRARLAKVSYVDAAGKPAGTRYGMLLEDDSDVAKRMEGRVVDLLRAQFKDVDAATTDTMMAFEYMLGSTDFSIYALHNVILVQRPDRTLYTIPYDFDMTGLVNPPYAIPDRQFPIKSVKERLYRGPCRTLAEIEPIAAQFNAQKVRVMALPDTIPDLDKSSREEARSFLEEFYASIKDRDGVKRVFVDRCTKAPAM